MNKNKQYNFVDLFAGCGGLSLGLQQAGFTPWFVNEIVEQFCNTYKYNHELSEEHYFVGDIAELNLHLDEYKEILSDITLVCGGPPCQGFSMANRQRILDDPRNALLVFLSGNAHGFFASNVPFDLRCFGHRAKGQRESSRHNGTVTMCHGQTSDC